MNYKRYTLVYNNNDNNNFDYIKEVFKDTIKTIKIDSGVFFFVLNDDSEVECMFFLDDIHKNYINNILETYSISADKNINIYNYLKMNFDSSNKSLTIKHICNSESNKDEFENRILTIASYYNALIIMPDNSVIDSEKRLILDLQGNSDIEITGINSIPTKEELEDIFTINVDTKKNFENFIDQEDLDRINKNIEVLKNKNIPYLKEMTLIPTKKNTTLLSKEKIFNEMINTYFVATCAVEYTQNYEESKDLIEYILNRLERIYKITDFIDEDTANIINSMINSEIEDNTAINCTWLYERTVIYLWILNLIDFPDQVNMCDVDKLNDLLFSVQEGDKPSIIKNLTKEQVFSNETNFKGIYNSILDSITMKSYDEILEKADLLVRYKWAIDESYVNNPSGKFNTYGMNMHLLTEQIEAFTFALKWNEEPEAEDNNYTKLIEATKEINYIIHSDCLSIPQLIEGDVLDSPDPNTILLVSSNGYTEQFISDGPLYNDSFEERVELVNKNTKEFLKTNNVENVDNCINFVEDYDNGVFKFKIYTCDIVRNIDNKKEVVRQLMAYFVEPNYKDFYLLSLSVGPFINPEMLKVYQFDLINDEVTKSLYAIFKELLGNLKYK